MKKILGLTIAAIMVLAMIGGGTYALFSDTETSDDNSWTVGTLNLVDVVSGSAVISDVVLTNLGDGSNSKVVFGSITPIIPGDSGSITWTLTNTGNVPGNITLGSILVNNAENYNLLTNEAEAVNDADTSNTLNGGELAANMDVVMFIDNGGGGGIANNHIQDGTEATIYTGKLNGIAGSYTPVLVLAASPGVTYISMTWIVTDTLTINTIMGDSSTLDITFALNQIP